MRQATVRITLVVAMMLAGWARAGSDELARAFTRPPEEARHRGGCQVDPVGST